MPGADRARLPRGGHGKRAGARDRAHGRLDRRGDAWRTGARAAAGRAGARRRRRAVAELAELLAGARGPALVVGAGADDAETWEALVALAERLAARSGRSPSAPGPDSRRIIGSSQATCRPTGTRLRETLAPHDVVLAVGAPVFRQYPYRPGPFVEAGTRVAMVSQDPPRCIEARRPAVLAHPAPVCAELARIVPERTARPRRCSAARAAAAAGARRSLRAGHVLAAIAERLPRERRRDRGIPVEPARAAGAPAGA